MADLDPSPNENPTPEDSRALAGELIEAGRGNCVATWDHYMGLCNQAAMMITTLEMRAEFHKAEVQRQRAFLMERIDAAESESADLSRSLVEMMEARDGAARARIAAEAERDLYAKMYTAAEAERDLAIAELRSIIADCEAEYPPSHGAIRQGALACLKTLGVEP